MGEGSVVGDKCGNDGEKADGCGGECVLRVRKHVVERDDRAQWRVTIGTKGGNMAKREGVYVTRKKTYNGVKCERVVKKVEANFG